MHFFDSTLKKLSHFHFEHKDNAKGAGGNSESLVLLLFTILARLYGNFLVWKQRSLPIATRHFGTFCARPCTDIFGHCAWQRVKKKCMHIDRCTILPPSPPPFLFFRMSCGSRQMLYPSLSFPFSLPLSPLYIPTSLCTFRNVARVQTDAVSPSLSFPFSLRCISLLPSVPLGMS